MLVLPSSVNSFQSKYSSSLAPGIRFALDLTDAGIDMSHHDKYPARSRDGGNVMTENANIFGLSRYPTWTAPAYDPFAGGSPGRRTPPEQSDHIRQQLPLDLQHLGRNSALTAVGEPLRPRSFATQPCSYVSDAPILQQAEISHSSTEESSLTARRQSQEYSSHADSPTSRSYSEYEIETHSKRDSDIGRSNQRYHTRRRPFNQDEFDGPSQLLPLPLPQQEHVRSQPLSNLPVHLDIREQDEVTSRINDILSQCAFHFVAKYQFPIPLERDKPRVRGPADREWIEWAYLLKRLATKRRIPARVLYDNQIKQFVTTLENSIAARQTNRDGQSRQAKDDRYILQLISAATQVAKILMDSMAMEQLDDLYLRTENVIMERRARIQQNPF